MHIFTNAAIDNIDSKNKQLLYTCKSEEDSDNAIIHSAIQLLMINNIGDKPASITIYINIARNTEQEEIILLKESKIEVSNSLVIERVINLQPNDSIYLQAEKENTLSAFCSILEVV